MTSPSSSFAAKAAAFVVFAAVLAGATWGVNALVGGDVVMQSVNAQASHDVLNATSGQTVSFAVKLHNRADVPAVLSATLEGLGASGTSAAATAPPLGDVTVFVPVAIEAETASGERLLDLRVMDAAGHVVRERVGFVKLDVLAPDVGFAMGDRAQVVYTGRIASTGAVFNSNDPVIINSPVTKTDFYRASPGLLSVETVPQVTVVDGFVEGMLGMQVGESRSITFGPEKGYGSATQERSEPRRERLERTFELDLAVDSVGAEAFRTFILESGQGDSAEYAVGDVFHFTQGDNRWPYRIVDKTSEAVDYVLHVEEGEAYTFYPFWPGGSVVQSVNETHAVFFTSPADVGQKFTMLSFWPQMSIIEEVTEDEIVVRHDPPQGLKYMMPGNQMQGPTEHTVVALEDDVIRVATPSTNPLAGRTLTFDVRVVSLTKG